MSDTAETASAAPAPGRGRNVLMARQVDAGYGKLRALSGVSFAVNAGSTVGVLGANGAGKSTLLKVLAGSLKPWAGSLHYDGEPVAGTPAWQLSRKGICFVPEGGGVFHELSVRDNLIMAKAGGASHEDLDLVASTFPILGKRLTQRAGSMSGGEKRMLALARALITRPRVLLVDEPSLGLAPVIVDQLFEVLDDLAAQGMAVVIVEQFADRVLQIADFAWVLTKGRVTYSGDAVTLKDEPELLEQAYLGVTRRPELPVPLDSPGQPLPAGAKPSPATRTQTGRRRAPRRTPTGER